MKISNLWLFFFQGAATGTAYVYDGRTDGHLLVRAATVGPANADDSRGYFRRNALARPAGVGARTAFARVGVAASAAAAVTGVGRRVACGTVVARAAGRGGGVLLDGRRAFLGQVRASASSRSEVLGASRASRSADARVSGGATVVVQGTFARARGGARSRVVVGHDQIEAELEEILLLMEVA